MRIKHYRHGRSDQNFYTDKKRVIIGRGSTADLQIREESVSREHCKIEVIDDYIWITDLDSKNGVFIDGVRIPNGIRCRYFATLPLKISLSHHIELINASDNTSNMIKIGTLRRMRQEHKLASKKIKPVAYGSWVRILIIFFMMIYLVYFFKYLHN